MKLKIYKLFIVVFLFSVCLFLSSQDESDIEPVLSNELNLLESTLEIDIDTASYYELLSWCQRLLLDTKGARSDLQKILKEYYNIQTEPVSVESTETDDQSVIIRAANNLDYFTIEIINENYIQLSGGVSLELADPENGGIHRIKAEKMIFNQSERTLSASGNIYYEMEKEGNIEVFRGESLSFNLNSWEGVFFHGISEKNKEVDGENISFYYSGNSIFRAANDIVILTDGEITSCNEEDPHYSIKVKKLFILAPGEWSIQNAVLQIGRVPLFYFPYFFFPGDELVFHPALGFQDENGYFIQTSTYLLGKKQEEDPSDSFSFLQLTDENDENLIQEWDGLYLRNKKIEEKDSLSEYTEKTGSFFRIMADYYTRMGFFGGIDGKISDIGILSNMDFYLGFGFSRNIYKDSYILPGTTVPIEYYSPYKPSPVDGIYESVWNKSYLFGRILPFRYGFNFNFKLQEGSFNLTGTFPIYSDPAFMSDFNNRREGMDWGELIGLGEEDDSNSGISSDGSAIAAITNLKWLVSTSLTADVSKLAPYISRLNISQAYASFNWQSKDFPIAETENDLYEAYSDSFFFPDSFLLPAVSGTVHGTLFSFSSDEAVNIVNDTTEKKEIKADIKPPIISSESSNAEYDNEQDSRIRIPELQENTPILKPEIVELTIFNHSLDYSISPMFSINNKIDYSDLEIPEDISFTASESIYNINGTAAFSYNAALFEKYISVHNVLTLSGKYMTDSLKTENQIDTSSYFRISDNISLTSYPFNFSEIFKDSRLSYTLNLYMYEKKYDDSLFNDYYIKWDIENIKTHRFDINLNMNYFNSNQLLTVLTILPPFNAEISPSITLKTGELSSTVAIKLKQEENNEQNLEWTIKPLSIKERFDFSQGNYIEGTLSHDFMEESPLYLFNTTTKLHFSLLDNNILFDQLLKTDFVNLDDTVNWGNITKSITSLKIWFLTIGLTAKESFPLLLDPNVGWGGYDTDAEFRLIPVNASALLNYNYNSDPFWKNRIVFSTNINSSWTMNLLRFTDTVFTFGVDFTFSIYEFLDLTFSSVSNNTASYTYIPYFADKLQEIGYSLTNPVTDLLNSFNIFDRTKREESNFNLQKISVVLTHHLHDWDLKIGYETEPQLRNNDEGYKQYEFVPRLSFFLEWKPIPEVKKKVSVIDNELSF